MPVSFIFLSGFMLALLGIAIGMALADGSVREVKLKPKDEEDKKIL